MKTNECGENEVYCHSNYHTRQMFTGKTSRCSCRDAITIHRQCIHECVLNGYFQLNHHSKKYHKQKVLTQSNFTATHHNLQCSSDRFASLKNVHVNTIGDLDDSHGDDEGSVDSKV